MKKLSALTGIRFFAAFYVFIFHMHLMFPLKFLMDSLQEIIERGAIGVNVFFVLSGFILTYTYQQKLKEGVSKSFYKEFLLKRLIRIYPAYLVGLIACLLITLPSFPVVLLDITMLESYIPQYAMKWYGGGAWSISTEFFFYFTFPFLIVALNPLSKRWLKLILLLTILLSSMPAIFHNIYPTDVIIYQLTYTFPVSRLFEFISGVVASLLVFKYDWRIREAVAITGILILAVYLARFGYLKGYTIHNFLVVPVTIAALVVCVRAEETVLFKFLGSKVMVYLGEISYGFYVLQIPLLMIPTDLISRGYLSEKSYWVIPVFFAVNLGLSALMYKYIEHPIHLYFNNRMKEKKLLRESKSIQPA